MIVRLLPRGMRQPGMCSKLNEGRRVTGTPYIILRPVYSMNDNANGPSIYDVCLLFTSIIFFLYVSFKYVSKSNSSNVHQCPSTRLRCIRHAA
ncbi:hypothetical protein BJX63DRAFT_392210 [Aspergillus granulosus]|uniref:Uncharacterized protein n=1 Tax=Aspergillus granulosus TaxID=176169 RepID=A0ABR4HFZ8_9EURO